MPAGPLQYRLSGPIPDGPPCYGWRMSGGPEIATQLAQSASVNEELAGRLPDARAAISEVLNGARDAYLRSHAADLYDALFALTGSVVVAINRAVAIETNMLAVGMAEDDPDPVGRHGPQRRPRAPRTPR